MKTTERFDNAVSKLYTAYHVGVLNKMDCGKCAVGNMCDGNEKWVYDIDDFRIIDKYTDLSELQDRKNYFNTGYSALEIAEIENIFMFGKNLQETKVYFDQAEFDNFKGLCAVLEYLCELDNIPNVMDYTRLFESENNEPKYQLTNELN